MHGNLSREDAVLDTSVPDQDVETKKASDWLVIAALAFGGVLTLAWVALLIWAALQLMSWVVG